MKTAQFDLELVVTGAVDLPLPQGVRELRNERWTEGQATSLRCAVDAARQAGASSLTIGLADQPRIPASAWRAVRNAPLEQPIVVATYRGRVGPHPVRLAASVWDALPDNGDSGARSLLQARPDLVHPVPCAGTADDVDTLADLANIADWLHVADLLGREPEGDFEVVVRDADGTPVVVRNAPLMHDGRPMPTLFWLTGRRQVREVSRLEAAGGVTAAQAAVSADALAAAHSRYAAERDARLPDGYAGPRPAGGVAGTRRGVKCLHAHYAYFLAGGDDPVGRWVAEQVAQP